MNARLVELTSKGWSVVDVDTASSEAEGAASAEEGAEPDEPDAVTGSIEIGTSWVTVDAEAREVTAEEALSALRRALGATRATGLKISGAQPFHAPWYQTVEPWCAAMSQLGSATLESVVVDTYFQPLTRQASVFCGDLTELFARCPSLRFGYVIGCAELRALRHERLEDLTLMGEPLGIETIRAVLRGPLPRLRRLDLGLRYEQSPEAGVDAALLAALREQRMPSLTELHLAYPEDALTLLAGLAESSVLGQLRVLSLRGNLFDDEDAAVGLLCEHRAAFGKLEKLCLPIEDMMDHEDEELREAIPGFCGHDAADAFDPKRYRA